MTPEQLKASILQLAIQGKLVEQRPEEGTSEDLYQQIQEEKQKLIKEGKLKKEKPLAPIADEEIPFDIPDSWRWVRVADLIQVLNGDRGKNYPSKDKLKEIGIPFVSASNLDGKTVVKDSNLKCLSEEQYSLLRAGKLQKDDILVCIRGSLGKCATYPFDKGAIASSLIICRPYIQKRSEIKDYVMNYLKSNLFYSEISKYDNGTAQPNLAAKDFCKFLLPLPPLAEQKRIVAKVEELFPLVEKYKKAYSELEILNSKFSGDMKKSILQYAIQGKLVEQRPEGGTSEDLYQQIQEEKQNLIKEGKLKKEKTLAPIEDDEIPFDIPEHWKWARLSSLVSVLGDGLHGTPSYDVNGNVYFINGNNLKNGKIVINDLTKKVSKEEAKKYYKDLNQSSLLVSINGTLGNVAFYDNEPVILGKSACYFNLIGHLDKYFFKVLIDSDYFQSYLTNFATGTTIKNVPLSAMRSVLIPLPPLAEQKRIVAKVEELIALCDKLKLK